MILSGQENKSQSHGEVISLEVGNQIKKYRSELKLSQEELAQKIYVTRQTVSNWENGKSYPDIHSLLMLSTLFNISLDQLIKGDVKVMKQEINKEEIARLKRLSAIVSTFLVISIILFIPLVKLMGIYGFIISSVPYLVACIFAFKIGKIKKKNNIHTYKEIVAFLDGKHLDEVQEQQEIGKRPYQKIILFVLCGLIGGVFGIIAYLIEKFL